MHKPTNRPRRIAELIKRELATLIPRELDDPRTHFVTLTFAEMARDLSSVRVYFTLPGGTADAKAVATALNRAGGFLRHALAERIALRVVPAIRFYYDESVERGARISSLIERAVNEDKAQGDK